MRNTILGGLLIFMGISFYNFDFIAFGESNQRKDLEKFLLPWKNLLDSEETSALANSFFTLLSEKKYEDAAVLAEYHELFHNPQLPVPLWASLWLSEEKILFTEETVEVRSLYRQHGFNIKAYGMEPEDHLGCELAFCGHLYDLAVLEHNDEALLSLKCFVQKHVSLWGPDCLKSLHKLAKTEYWKTMFAVSDYVVNCLHQELDITESMSKNPLYDVEYEESESIAREQENIA